LNFLKNQVALCFSSSGIADCRDGRQFGVEMDAAPPKFVGVFLLEVLQFARGDATARRRERFADRCMPQSSYVSLRSTRRGTQSGETVALIRDRQHAWPSAADDAGEIGHVCTGSGLFDVPPTLVEVVGLVRLSQPAAYKRFEHVGAELVHVDTNELPGGPRSFRSARVPHLHESGAKPSNVRVENRHRVDALQQAHVFELAHVRVESDFAFHPSCTMDAAVSQYSRTWENRGVAGTRMYGKHSAPARAACRTTRVKVPLLPPDVYAVSFDYEGGTAMSNFRPE
jgi:hypothetical protein